MEAIMPAFVTPVTPGSLRPGTVVSVRVFPFFRHKGVVSDRFFGDKPMVISNSARAGGVAEEPWDVFAAGQTVLAEGYPSNLPPSVVLHRARTLIGVRYHPISWNCEHLTTYAHGFEPKSPQLAATVILALIAVGVGAARA